MDLWVNQNQCNVLLFLILWKGKRKLKKKNVFQKVVQVFHSSLNYFLNMVRIWMVFCINFNTFNSCFTTFLSSTEALHKFFEGCRLVVFSLLCNIWYLWGDGGCSKRVIILRFYFTISVYSLQLCSWLKDCEALCLPSHFYEFRIMFVCFRLMWCCFRFLIFNFC